MAQNQIHVFHLIQGLFRGGAARAMIATAKYSKEFGNYKHSVGCLTPWEAEALPLLTEAGVDFLPTLDLQEIKKACAQADIVQVEWWNTPQMDAFLRQPLPALRLLSWFHVAGNRDPQYITPEIVAFSDVALASSPQCYDAPAIQALSPELRLEKSGMVYDATDFARVEGIVPKPHSRFTVGYIGTVDFFKMHPNFVAMSAAVSVPDVRFVVCGGGKEAILRQQAEALGAGSKFALKGYVEDIRSEIAEFDVYGYPLCEDTYASAELNLQEVMYAGVPPVVFPYGGVGQLVVNDFTGLVVKSEIEYSQAIEYLYRNPEERKRLGANAREYARQIFGGRNAGKKFHQIYQRMVEWPKRERAWGKDASKPLLNQPINLADLGLTPNYLGASRFVESLVDTRDHFEASLRRQSITTTLNSEAAIAAMSPLMRASGIYPYRAIYPNDPMLRLWHGLVLFGAGDFTTAITEFGTALQMGLNRPEILWYVAQAAAYSGNTPLALDVLAKLAAVEPEFIGLTVAASALKSGAKPKATTKLNQFFS